MNIKELLHLPAEKLKRLVALKTEIERLEAQLANVIIAAVPSPIGKIIRAKRKMSAAARRKISMAAKARWAKFRGAKAKVPAAAKAPRKKKRTMSAAARQKISLAAKARWAKVRAAKAK